MRHLRTAALLVLLGLCACAAPASDSLRTSDSLRDARQAMPLWSDSSLAHADSLAGGRRAMDRWYVPLGIIVLTGVSAYFLFSTRSK